MAHTVDKTKISYDLDHPIPKEDFANRNIKLFENKASGNQEIFSGLGIYRDRNKKRSCSSVYGDPSEVCRKQSSGNYQKDYQQISKQEVCFLEKDILG